MTLGEMKQQYRMLQEEIRQLEAECAAAIGRGDPVSGRIRLGLAEARISAEELRTWGNRELTRLIRESTLRGGDRVSGFVRFTLHIAARRERR